jgi:hypothetical protein
MKSAIEEPLLSCKELAEALRRHVRYVYAMRAKGFVMPGGSATLTEAREWLAKNPCPKSRGKSGHIRAQ